MLLMISLLIGAGLGSLLGHSGKGSSGSRVLPPTWRRGAVYGAVVGLGVYAVSGIRGSASLNESTANVKRINEGQFDAEVTQSSAPVVMDVYATWCGPCKILSPMLDELAGALTNKVKFVKINLDEASGLAERLEVAVVPTLVFFKKGKIVDRVVGLPSGDTLKMRLESFAKEEAAPAVN